MEPSARTPDAVEEAALIKEYSDWLQIDLCLNFESNLPICRATTLRLRDVCCLLMKTSVSRLSLAQKIKASAMKRLFLRE
jgi:hypothetical protein